MDINNLKYFEKVAKMQHITKAAKELHIAQPALSQMIHKLEKELGVPLFTPKGRNIVLTKYGKNLLEIVEPIINDFDDIKHRMNGLTAIEDVTININVLAASMLVTDAILNYKKDNDEVVFNFSQVATNNSDIVISTTRDEVHVDDLTSVITEEIFLAVPKSDISSNANSVDLLDMKDKKFAAIYGKGIRYITDIYCRESGFKPNIVFESDNTTSVRNFIEAGLGVGFWPSFTWGGRKSEKFKLLPISYPRCYRNIVIKKKRNKVNNDTVDKFYDYLTEYFERLAL
ncbi:MAG: LysR family transcriptional regulator [Peptostreptococcaceae bacterium]|nr:LysR family transcriptional regulator [Peptostreptococcaceae bacterium]